MAVRRRSSTCGCRSIRRRTSPPRIRRSARSAGSASSRRAAEPGPRPGRASRGAVPPAAGWPCGRAAVPSASRQGRWVSLSAAQAEQSALPRLQRECREADVFGVDHVDGCPPLVDEPEQLPERRLPKLKRMERKRIRFLTVIVLGVNRWAITCPERLLKRQRIADVLHEPTVGRQAQRAAELPIRLPHSESEPVDNAVHRVEIDRASGTYLDEAAIDSGRPVDAQFPRADDSSSGPDGGVDLVVRRIAFQQRDVLKLCHRAAGKETLNEALGGLTVQRWSLTHHARNVLFGVEHHPIFRAHVSGLYPISLGSG